MKRRSLLQSTASAALLLMLPKRLLARSAFGRRRPPDALWPSKSAWGKLGRDVGGHLVPVRIPLNQFSNFNNPYYIGDQPGLTQTLGWVDAWTTKPSVFAVAARSSDDIAAAIAFARDNDLRLVVKGGGHSYLGTSNAPDSLLIWTRYMNDVAIRGDSVTLGAGSIWKDAYAAVTTTAGRYVQGGGCTTVGVAGLIQSGGFGSFSKHFGTAASSLLQAEVVTADGKVRTVNSQTDPDLFWALKGGGGGTFGVVSQVTLRLHDLPAYFGAAFATIKASSDTSYRRLIREFVSFYSESLFDDHWGETVTMRPDNALSISMVSQGLETAQIVAVWKPFFDWLGHSAGDYTIDSPPILLGVPARHWWDVAFWRAHAPNIIASDSRPGHGNDWWWAGNGGEAGWFLNGYASLWLPESLLRSDAQEHLVRALFAASRHSHFQLHFNKGLAGAPVAAIESAKDTATNPSVLSAFALAICADAQGPAYPGVPGREPDYIAGRRSALAIDQCMGELRAVAPQGGAYVSESDYFEGTWQSSYWGSNYPRLVSVKKKYDPYGLFFVHHGVGCEGWSSDGFRKFS